VLRVSSPFHVCPDLENQIFYIIKEKKEK
jgi:hypothetical protein